MQTKEGKGLALLDRTIFTYSISHLSTTDKVRFYYALKGRKGDAGIISELGITQLGKTVLLCDSVHDKQLSEFLASWGCQYSYLPICVREERPTTQMVSTPLDEIGAIREKAELEDESALSQSSSEGMKGAIALRHARALIRPTPKYPIKMGTVRRISLRTEKAIVQKGNGRRSEDTELTIRRIQEQIDTLIERQAGIRVSEEGLEWLSVNSLPALDGETDEIYSVQETALIRQKKQAEGKSAAASKKTDDGMEVRRAP